MIGAVIIILGVIGKKKEIPESIIRRFWSIIDLSLDLRHKKISNVTQSWETVPNCTSGKIKLIPPAYTQ